jgi:biopolymer transport protein ExbD
MMVGARGARSCEINVTPLIDVLLVLLIIFMVILPEHPVGEAALIPQPAPNNLAPNPLPPIVIQLEDGKSNDTQPEDTDENRRPDLMINSEKIQWDGLEARLREIYAQRNDRTAFVKGGPEIEFAYVAEVLDITHHAGADRVGLLGQIDRGQN